MLEYPATHRSPTLVFAHGAGAGQEHPWIVRAAKGLAARGIRVVTFNFPYKDAGRSAPDPGGVLEDAFAAVWRKAAAGAGGKLFAGGKSMGGRIASQAAARGLFEPAAAGLVFFGWGEIFSLFPSTLTDTFGTKNATANYGLLYMAQGVGSVLGGPTAAFLHDKAGSWVPVFSLVIGLDILTGLLALFVLKKMRANLMK